MVSWQHESCCGLKRAFWTPAWPARTFTDRGFVSFCAWSTMRRRSCARRAAQLLLVGAPVSNPIGHSQPHIQFSAPPLCTVRPPLGNKALAYYQQESRAALT